MDNYEIKITETGENKGKVEVAHAGQVHHGLWWGKDDGGIGTVRPYVGNGNTLTAALLAWGAYFDHANNPGKVHEFTVTRDQLQNSSQGWGIE